MKHAFLTLLVLMTACVAFAQESDFTSLAAKTAKTKYEGALQEAQRNYLQDLKRALDSAMSSRDIDEANRIRAVVAQIEKDLAALAGTLSEKKATVKATQTQADPHKTGIRLKKGQRFRLLPNADDKWTGGGSQAGSFCSYMGHRLGDPWMRLHYRIGNGNSVPVETGVDYEADTDGELMLFAYDGAAAGNKGQVRVTIVYRK